MYTQRLPDLGEQINTYGCALMSVAAAVSALHPMRHITPGDIRKVYSEAQRSGVMGKNCYIEDWAGVFRLFGIAVKYYGHKDATWTPMEGEIEITEWKHNKLRFTHFTLGGATDRHPFYDPWGAAGGNGLTSRSVAEGYIASKRGFKLLEA